VAAALNIRNATVELDWPLPEKTSNNRGDPCREVGGFKRGVKK